MIRYLIARILSAIPVIGVVTIVVFGLTYLGPGDAASLMAGDYASPADIAALRVKLHLDDPIITQYIYWLGNVLKGDFGHSIFFSATGVSFNPVTGGADNHPCNCRNFSGRGRGGTAGTPSSSQ